MSKRRFGVTILVMLALALSLVCFTVPQTNDPVPLIISPGTDGIAEIKAGYNVSIDDVSIVVDANTTFTDVVRLYCPVGYNDTIGIANLALNSTQIKELQIFVNYTNQKTILTHYRNGSIVQNATFKLYPQTEAIMGISIIPTPTVKYAGPIDPISYNIVCIYEVVAVGPPVAKFTVLPDPPYYAPATLTFNASDSTPNGGEIISYAWDFGDNTTGTGNITTHTYTTNGTYPVTLNVTDSEGLWNTTTTILTVDRLDVAVIGVTPSISEAYTTWTIQVNVTVLNNGTQTINCTVAAYYNASTWYEIGTQNVTNLAPSAQTTRTFNWALENVPYHNHTIKANATLINGPDANPDNNEKVDGQVFVKMPGDASGDYWVDGIDLVMYLAPAFNSHGPDIPYPGRPASPSWNLQCDFNGDGWVDGVDLVMYLAPNFNKSY